MHHPLNPGEFGNGRKRSYDSTDGEPYLNYHNVTNNAIQPLRAPDVIHNLSTHVPRRLESLHLHSIQT